MIGSEYIWNILNSDPVELEEPNISAAKLPQNQHFKSLTAPECRKDVSCLRVYHNWMCNYTENLQVITDNFKLKKKNLKFLKNSFWYTYMLYIEWCHQLWSP